MVDDYKHETTSFLEPAIELIDKEDYVGAIASCSNVINFLSDMSAYDSERLDGVPRLLDEMTKEQLALTIARAIYKNKGKLESFHAFQCIQSYFCDLSMDDLEGIAAQYGINI